MNRILRFPADAGQAIAVYSVDAGGNVRTESVIADLADIDTLPAAQHTAVLLPGQLVRLLRVELPKMSAQELTEAIPYAIEEQLADDVDDAFIVRARGAFAGGALSVMVCQREYFMSLFQALKHQGVNASLMMADGLALNWQPGRWSIACVGDSVLWRSSMDQAVSFDRDQFAFCWPMIVREYAEQLPEAIDVYGDEARDAVLFEQSDCDVTQQWHRADLWLDGDLVQDATGMNFLQGKYRLHSRMSKLKRRWMQSVAVVLGCVLVSFSANVAGYYAMRHQNSQVLSEISRLMTAAGVDSEQGPGAARGLIAAELKHYQQLRHANVWVEMLQAIGPAIHQDVHWQLQAMDYSKGRLTLTLREIGQASLQHLMSQMQASGVNVKQLSSRNSRGDVTLLVTQRGV